MNALDKEEFRIKLEEINKLVQDKDYKGAMNIVDSIDWRRVKNVRTLCVVGEIYAANGRYEDSKEIFLLAYHKASIGKNILYRLIEISLRMDDINEAEEFFEEYKQVASNDSTQYILQYKIARAKNSSLNEQIRILEEYKEQEFTEKWSYELAALYYKAGEKQKCLDLCNEIILWFSEGKYVMKAYDLKMRMGELTGAEKAKFEKQFVPKLLTPEQAKELEKKKTETEVKAQEEPEAEEVDFELNPGDLRIDTYRASGAGGQHINKTDSAVRITHIPTGTVTTSQDGRSQHDNKDKAMRAMRTKLYEMKLREQEEAIGSERRNKIGSGDRSEKIRTYNYPQNRVTDHRIGLTIQQLDRIMEGKLEEIIEALINEDQRLKLAGEEE